MNEYTEQGLVFQNNAEMTDLYARNQREVIMTERQMLEGNEHLTPGRGGH